MTNYRRSRVAGGSYFFTVVTHHRRRFLVDELARTALRVALKEVRQRYPVTIEAIVLLPDHLHKVWTLPLGDADYSTRWRLVKARFTQLYLASGGLEAGASKSRQNKSERGVWQRRFFEHTCRSDADFRRCVDYVHVNPLKHCLVQRVSDWPWSTFHRYVRLGEYDSNWGSSAEWYGDEWNRFE